MDKNLIDDFLFIEENQCDKNQQLKNTTEFWHILIADDDKEVHTLTELALSDINFLGKSLQFHHAYSAREALKILKSTQSIAILLLDVVMENDYAGLDIIETIRHKLGLVELRIILRTGQAGTVPEEHIIRDYDINDYKNKTELTRSKLLTSLYTAIRTYEQIRTIHRSQLGLESIIESTTNLFKQRTTNSFTQHVLLKIAELFHIPKHGLVCTWVHSDVKTINIIGAIGDFEPLVTLDIDKAVDKTLANNIQHCLKTQQHHYTDNETYLFASSGQCQVAIYFNYRQPLLPMEKQLLNVFLHTIAVGFEYVNLFQQIRQVAYKDWLTTLPNRAEFIHNLNQFIQQTLRGDMVALVDIEHFADINNGLGIEIGNQLLVAIAERLKKFFSQSCTLARVDADVFGLIGDQLIVNYEQIQQIFRHPFAVGEHTISVSAKVGFRPKQGAEGPGSLVLQQCFMALNKAKNAGEKFTYYTMEISEETAWRTGMIRRLREDFAQRKLEVWFQPQICLENNRIVGLEALLRWPTDEGYISPAVFIPLAEYCGLIVDIGLWVLEQSCQQIKQLENIGFNDLTVSVNVSIPQFRQSDFIEQVTSTLVLYQVEASQLELEITESVIMDEPDVVVNTLKALRKLGVHIALDDFGTGYSSLCYLQQLPLDRIKIDATFVRNLDQAIGATIVESVIGLAHKLNLSITAEGIETEEQRQFLCSLKCELGQGYYYAKPMPRHQLVSCLEKDCGCLLPGQG